MLKLEKKQNTLSTSQILKIPKALLYSLLITFQAFKLSVRELLQNKSKIYCVSDVYNL